MRLLILVLSLFLSISAYSNTLYDYKVLRILDGDTVEIEAPYLPKELKKVLKLRIKGIDTPEKGSKSKCIKEDKLSLNSKLYLEQEIRNGKVIKIILYTWDKYGGRVLGDIMIDGELVSKRMIKSGYAIEYNGRGAKYDWCK